MRTSWSVGLIGLAAMLAIASPAGAQAPNYPQRPIKLIVPFAAGGNTDIIGRLIAPPMSEALGQQVVVENRAGAGTVVGSEAAAHAAPDGYTILLTTIAHAVNPALYKKLPFDPVKDFEPIGLVAKVPVVLVVHPALAATDLKSLIALLKSKPGSVNYASAGAGSVQHLAGEWFKYKAGVDIVHVPYRGSGPAVQDLVAGQVSMMLEPVPTMQQHIQGGTVRAIAVANETRVPTLPQVPTMAEAGLPDFVAYTWFGLFGPGKLPEPIIAKLSAAIATSLANPALREHMEKIGAEPVDRPTPAGLKTFLAAEMDRWIPIVKASGAQVD
jgi:tripartite-type tricarboxylate transporter receptor subunit TctC